MDTKEHDPKPEHQPMSVKTKFEMEDNKGESNPIDGEKYSLAISALYDIAYKCDSKKAANYAKSVLKKL